jgi:Berberine and berberine like
VTAAASGLTWANLLRPFQVGKARTSQDGPSSWIREPRVVSAQESWPACHFTNADTVEAAETTWARKFLAALQPHSAGVYVNFLDSDDDMSRIREAYGDDTYRRLTEVKARYDPENVFHNNKNIQPTTPAQRVAAIG